jgi:hypothetical protein
MIVYYHMFFTATIIMYPSYSHLIIMVIPILFYPLSPRHPILTRAIFSQSNHLNHILKTQRISMVNVFLKPS